MDKYFWLKIVLNVFELVSFITGIFCWNKVHNTYWRWFVFYLGVIFFTEMLGKYVGYGLKDPQLNADIYFFFGIPVQFVFLFWLFYKWFSKRRDKLVPLTGLILYITAWVIDLLVFKDRKMWFSSFSYLVGNLVLFLTLIVFFLRFVNSNEVIDFRNSMIFWVGTGMLIFYIGTLPFYGLRNFWYYNYEQVFYPYWVATFIFGALMYLFFAFAFIWGKLK
jgi:hypothetical protein